nr:hypothetical protein [Tanacetum cinerariifolium]
CAGARAARRGHRRQRLWLLHPHRACWLLHLRSQLCGLRHPNAPTNPKYQPAPRLQAEARWQRAKRSSGDRPQRRGQHQQGADGRGNARPEANSQGAGALWREGRDKN